MARANNFEKGMSLGKVAEYCGVTRKTILRWAQDGMLPSFTLPGGHHRVLPDTLARFLASHNMPVPEELRQAGQGSVLIVDDDQHIRRLIRDLLSPHFHVDQAASLVEACLMLGEKAPDLLVIDNKALGSEAVQLFTLMQKDSRLTQVKVIVTASEVTPELRNRLRDYAQQILQKPFAPRSLLQTCLSLFPALEAKLQP